MTRRDLIWLALWFSSVGAALTKMLPLPLSGLASNAATAAADFESSFVGIRKSYGYVDVDRWFRIPGHERMSVLLDGRDITDGCIWFNDVTGEAECYKRDVAGEFYSEPIDPEYWMPQRIASERLRGRIEVVG